MAVDNVSTALHRVLASLRRWLTPRAPVAPALPAANDTDLLLYHRLAQAGIDPDFVAKFEPALMEDMAQSCGHCGYTGRCARDLNEDDGNDQVAGYCPNTPKIDDLVIKKHTG